MTNGLTLLVIHLWSIVIKLCSNFDNNISKISTNMYFFWFQPKMSGFFQNYVRDPRSQDHNFLELWLLSPQNLNSYMDLVGFGSFEQL
jgi:hypothetical protein